MYQWDEDDEWMTLMAWVAVLILSTGLILRMACTSGHP